jgi:hypothetical protein
LDKYHKTIWINHSPSSLGVETSPEPIFSHSSIALVLHSGKAVLCFILAQGLSLGCTVATIKYDDHACSVAFEYAYSYEIEHYP